MFHLKSLYDLLAGHQKRIENAVVSSGRLNYPDTLYELRLRARLCQHTSSQAKLSNALIVHLSPGASLDVLAALLAWISVQSSSSQPCLNLSFRFTEDWPGFDIELGGCHAQMWPQSPIS